MTSLHAATQYRHTEVVRVLLEHGANKDIMDKDGYTVMSFTEDFLKQELFDLLHPELALARSAIEQMVQAKIDQYTASHGFTIDKETLRKRSQLGSNILRDLATTPLLKRRPRALPRGQTLSPMCCSWPPSASRHLKT